MSDILDMEAPGREAASRVRARGVEPIVPRVSVEAFGVTPDFAAAVRSAADDRRMAKARASIHMGGVDAAVKRYAMSSTPNLIIVESLSTGFSVLNELEALANLCDKNVQVMVAGPSNDVTLYRELMRQGVSEYLVTPCGPMQIIEAISGAYNDPTAAPKARMVTCYGLRGGAGASVVAHNASYLLATELRRDTLLMDLNLEFGTAALNFNAEPKHSVAEALADVANFDDVKLERLVHRQAEHLRFLAAPVDLRPRGPGDADAALAVVEMARGCCESLVLDAAAGWGASSQVALRQADDILLVATPDIASLRNLKTVADWITAERPQDAPPRLVMNMVGEPKRAQLPVREFENILGSEAALVWPYDAALFGVAQNEGKMLGEFISGRRHVDALAGLIETLLGRPSRADAVEAKRSPLAKRIWPFNK